MKSFLGKYPFYLWCLTQRKLRNWILKYENFFSKTFENFCDSENVIKQFFENLIATEVY